MTPTARLSAAIDILTEIDKGLMADRVLAGWAKANRYAGSKDRAAIQVRVFDVLRNRALFARAMGTDAPRALIIASLHVGEGVSIDEVKAHFSGAKFAPAPMDETEEAALVAAAEKAQAATEVDKLNLPEWLVPEFEGAFGNSWRDELVTLNGRAPADLRANRALSNRTAAQQLLRNEGIETSLAPFSPWGLRAETPARVTHTKLFKEGLVEIQDEGSQLTCLLAGVKKGEIWVDLCAGAGGKTLALLASLEGEGRLVACDTDVRRLGRLQPRVERATGAPVEICVLHDFDPSLPDPDLADLEGRADGVFVDAPCSGSGAWRRQPEARWLLTPEKLSAYQALQAEVLARGARLVRPGGRLIYVTCSLFRSENEDQVARFLKEYGVFELADWQNHWPADVPKPKVSVGSALRLSPFTTNTDGFFVAILERLR